MKTTEVQALITCRMEKSKYIENAKEFYQAIDRFLKKEDK